MSLTDIHIAGYRSIRSIHFPVRQLSVLVGANGVGKTNLYRALELVRAAATGETFAFVVHPAVFRIGGNARCGCLRVKRLRAGIFDAKFHGSNIAHHDGRRA